MQKYIMLADGKSPHTLKWIVELKKYFDIYLISLNGYDQSILEYIDKSKVYSLNDSVKSSGGNYKQLLQYLKISKIITKIKPRYLNAHYLSSYGLLGVLIKKFHPNLVLIQSTWGSDILVTPKKSFVYKLTAKFALKYADMITSDSYFMSDEINKIYQNNITETFPFGLDYVDMNEEIVKDENLIFSNRALSKNYNIATVIEWFGNLENQEMKLVIANDGNDKKELLDLVDSLKIQKRVTFVGFLTKDEQNHYYKQAKYYISIPSSDSTAVSLLEAMSFGCYPIVSNLPANREWIIDNFNGSFFYRNLSLLKSDKNVVMYNKQIINANAIFSKSILQFIKKLEQL